MDIEIKKHSRIKDFFHKITDKLEDILFSIILSLPEKWIPHFLMDYLNQYTTKRLNQLKQQTTRQEWEQIYLQKAVEDIRQRDKASSDD